MKFMRRIKRGNVHPVYGTKFRKGNKGDKLDKLQEIVVRDNVETMVNKKNGETIHYINRCKPKRVVTRLHWKT